MSSSSNWKSSPIEGMDFLNQPCNRCGKNAVIKISGSINNPRKAYFKCEDCKHFVTWLTQDHIVMMKKIHSKKVCGEESSEEDEVGSGGINKDIVGLKNDFKELAYFLKFYVKLIAALMMLTLVFVVMFKV